MIRDHDDPLIAESRELRAAKPIKVEGPINLDELTLDEFDAYFDWAEQYAELQYRLQA